MTLSTTLRLLRQHDACKDRYIHLRRALGRGYGDTTPIPLLRVLELNGLGDALWALRAVPEARADKVARLLAADYAAHVLPVFERARPGDMRVRECIRTVRRFAAGRATQEERAAAWAAAGAAAWAVARDAAWTAAWVAVGAAGDAARAADAAAGAVARDAAWAAAWVAVGAAGVAVGAAGDAARAADAAAGAAGDAAWAADAAAGAVARDAAWAAAWAVARDAERRWQEARLRRYLTGAKLPRPIPLRKATT